MLIKIMLKSLHRPLLFETTADLASPKHDSAIPELVLCHHVIVRAPETLQLPHQQHGWQEAEYVRWVNEHEVREQLQLVRGCLDKWNSGYEQQLAENGDAKIVVETLEHILGRTLGSDTSS